MRLSTLVTLIFTQVQADVIYQISNVNLNTDRPIYRYFDGDNCTNQKVSIKCQFLPQIVTSNYMAQTALEDQFIARTESSIVFKNSATFQVSPATSYILIAILYFSCDTYSTFQDYVIIRSEDSDSFDGTFQSQLNLKAVNNTGIQVSLTFNRTCSDPSKLGLQCNESCTKTENDEFCYTCDNQGHQECCHNMWIDSQNCAWLNATNAPTTTTTREPCHKEITDNGKENLYFWLMIGFVILSAILILLLIFCLILLCMKRNNKPQTVAPVYVQPVRRSEVIESRRVPERNRTRSREAPPYPSYRQESPRRRRTREDPRGSFQFEYDVDDDSLRDDWVEPMPRRVAKNSIERHRSSPKEPRDVVV